MSVQSKIIPFTINFFFLLVCLGILFPFLLVIIVSLSSQDSITDIGYRFIPNALSLEAYKLIFDSPKIIFRAYGVTAFITLVGTFLSLLMTALTAYPMSRRDYAYNRQLAFYIYFTMLFSGGLVPSYILITQYLHMKDTIWALIIPYLLNPFNIMLMKGFMSKIPHELLESAKVDGAREFRIFFTIVLPLSAPALATLGLIISFAFWNSWFPGMLYIDKDSLAPLQLLLVRIMNNLEFLSSSSEFTQGLSIDTSKLPSDSTRMAMAIVAAGPMLVIFPFFQRYFVKGLTVGSLKG
ncbi:carbohydrate ABC transporter permease [Paenibacillus gansuensis]|uniref:Carbohydrate ABC transporter permease n=1 Tax=Paenibacillus gansuensis TaxID=306542 RepID=A0ABW5PAT7_9BACL